jgi:REP element-mobilizing transposase RayT
MAYKWFDHLKEQGYGTAAYVIMLNHVHTIHTSRNQDLILIKLSEMPNGLWRMKFRPAGVSPIFD